MLRFARWLQLVPVVGLLSLAPLAAGAQATATITGIVKNDFGDPIQSANVYIVELALSVATTPAGRYTIVVPSERVRGQAVELRARAIGFKAIAKPITVSAGTQTLDFTLVRDVNRLSDIVVTGVTGATEQTKTPFAVTRVTADQMPVPAMNPLTQLQGKVAGAQIVSASGRPGAAPSVILRAPTSINAAGRSQEPLYVVDGIIINGGLPDLNPEDIESVEVVKGAAAASLYGARAGNGVIQITTKTGKTASQNSLRFGFRSEIGTGELERSISIAQRHGLFTDETGTRLCSSTAPAVPGMLFACYNTVNYQREALRINEGGGESALNPVGFPYDPGASVQGQQARSVFQAAQWPVETFDAVGQLYQPQPTTLNNFDVTGRFGKTTFFGSVNRLDQGGTIRFLNGFQRSSARLNVDQQVNDKLSFNASAFFSRSKQDGFNQEDGGGAFFRLTRTPPLVDLTRTDSLGRLLVRSNVQSAGQQNENALYSLQNVKRLDQNDRFLAGATGRYTPLSWLDFEANFSFDQNSSGGFQNTEKGFRTTQPDPATNGGNVFRFNGDGQSYNTSVNATARWEPFDFLRTRYTLRYIAEEQRFSGVTSSGTNLGLVGVPQIGNTLASTRSGTSNQSTIRGTGYFGSVNAEYKGRYIVDGLVRRDASSLFGAGQRWQTFGRGSLAWRLSEEPWWFVPKLNELKLRASYGTAGGRPNFQAQYETFSLNAAGVAVPGVLGNSNLRPEISREVEYGADFEFFNRLGGNITYAKTRVTDQIDQAPLPVAAGFTSQWQNIGTLSNSAFEVSLNMPIISRRNFNWTARATYDRIRSKVTELNRPAYNFGNGNVTNSGGIFRVEEGVPYGTMYGRAFVRDCGQLPGAFRSQCGGAGQAFQRNSDGLIVWVGEGNTQADGIAKNLWMATLPATAAPFGVATAWGHPMIRRDTTFATNNPGLQLAIGNALPDYRWSTSQTVTYKRLTLNGLIDASVGKSVQNQGLAWSLLDFMWAGADQAGQSTATARPQSYYYRAGPPDNGAGIGGLYDVLGPNDFNVEKASFARLREMLVSYRVGRIAGVGDWSVSLIGRNLYTWTKYRGYDPEVGIQGNSGQAGSGVLNAFDNFTFPNIRTFTFSLGTTF
ncbi:MAG TPA: SusC/RagA family TonB-linked outer membrane protein [Gemmatimonas sp.]|nr:SusC/RagA family TonB-linked outer membrane protein [Gemmatimonas sp.]